MATSSARARAEKSRNGFSQTTETSLRYFKIVSVTEEKKYKESFCCYSVMTRCTFRCHSKRDSIVRRGYKEIMNSLRSLSRTSKATVTDCCIRMFAM